MTFRKKQSLGVTFYQISTLYCVPGAKTRNPTVLQKTCVWIRKKHFLFVYHNPVGPTVWRMWIVFSSVRQACVVTNLHNCTKQPCQRYINKALNELSRKPEEDRSTTNWHYSTVEQRGKNEWLCGHERQQIALLSSLSSYRHTCLGLYWLSVLDGPYSVKKIKCLWWEASYSPRCIS